MKTVLARRLAPWLLFGCASACASPPPPAPPPVPTAAATDTSDDAAIQAAEQDFVDLASALSPEHATELGLHSHDTELDDRSPEAFARSIAREEAMLTSLRERFGNPHASRAARTDLAIMTHALAVDVRLNKERRPLERQPDLYTSPMGALFLMLARDYAPAAERAGNVLARMEKIPAVIAAAKSNLKNPPRLWTQIGIERAGSAKQFFEEQRPVLEAALPADKARIAAAVRTATDAYADYRGYLEKQVLPRSNGDYAAGKPLFEFLVHEGYFLDDSVDSLYDLGQQIFSKTDAQMTEIARRLDPQAKGWPEVTAKVKAKHPTADGLLGAYRDEVQRARAFLVAHDVVPFPPGDILEVIETPPFQRTTITAAYDAPPPFDQNTKGLFFVTPVDRSLPPERQEEMLRENDHGDVVDTVVHEAYPGHHLQLSFARRNPSLVRKATASSILEEGWGLYSEELMGELGYYTDEERLMQLEWTLVRAARVMIDIGLHTRGMTFDQGVALLTDKVHLEHELAVSEVKRYTQSPTQPMSYLIGREILFRLRERCRARDKDKFSLKAFHADVLSRGSVPPGVIEREMFAP